MKRLLALWKGKPEKTRTQWIGGLCLGLAVLYTVLIWPLGHQRLTDLLYQEEKLAVRQKASGKNGTPKAPPDLGGLSPQQARKELSKVQESVASLQGEQERLNERFVALDDLESLQALKSELTRLAETGDMEVLALEHLYLRNEDRDRPPSPELLKEAAEGNPYKRPLLRLKAKASYRGLMQFLDGLNNLSHIAAPVWSDIEVKSEKVENNRSPLGGSSSPKQWLEVEIRLAI